MTSEFTLPGPIRMEITIAVDPDHAFDAFTRGFGSWWPVATHSLSRDKCKLVEMHPGLGGEIVEHATGKDPLVWGKIEIWQPGEHLAFTWHPGWDDDTYTRVSLSFEQNAFGRCVIVLEHRDWENLGEIGPMMRKGYIDGWKHVLGRCFVNYLTAKRH